MKSVMQLAVAIAAIIATGTATQAQVRVRTQPAVVAPAAPAIVVPIAWQPMPVMPVPISLSAGERIVLKGMSFAAGSSEPADNGEYAALEKRNGVWSRITLRVHCYIPQVAACTGFKTSNGRCCTCARWATEDFPPGVEVRALVDMTSNANPSEVFTLQEIGTLAAPVNSSPGLQQAILDKGQSLTLINNRTLSMITVGWGARYYVLKSGSQQIGKWSAARLITDASLRLALLTSIGKHRSDNWGIPTNVLLSLK